MPEQNWQEMRFKPTKEQTDLYNRMRLDFIAEVRQGLDAKGRP